MRPYVADVTSRTWPAWHCALNVSQLQYSLTKPEFKNPLLYNILWASCSMECLGVWIHRLHDASPKSHPSILCWFHKNDLTWFALCTKGLPVAVLPDHTWIIKLLLYNVFGAANLMESLGVWIHGLPYAPAKLHPSIFCRLHHYDLAWSTLSTKCLPIAILSDQTWIQKFSYFIMSSWHPISWTVLVSASSDFRTHLPYLILP